MQICIDCVNAKDPVASQRAKINRRQRERGIKNLIDLTVGGDSNFVYCDLGYESSGKNYHTFAARISACWRQSSAGKETRFGTCWLRNKNLNTL